MERIKNDYLMWWVESRNLIPGNFCGFRRGKSCYDNLANLRLDLDIARLQGLFMGVIFIDIEGAYDNVNIKTLIAHLIQIKVPPTIVKYIAESFTDRELSGYSGSFRLGTRSTNKGLPQGSILSPLLFNIYLHDIERKLPDGVIFSSFADDIRISTSHASMHILLETLRNYLMALETKLNLHSLSIFYAKTKLLLFGSGKKSSIENSKSIVIRNPTISNVLKARYLGVIWDANLNWQAHIENVCVKARKQLNILFAVAKFNWGAHPSTILQVYKSFIRPGLEWAGFLFNSNSFVQLHKLNVVQNTALRTGLGCLSTTPINILYHLSGNLDTR